ncbi:uncharacterized protein N7518_005999 [Penicillium psychrosexuale]|uniref:uncharacterized protein n=1 Tax=Penicillium psychrosexuale TaxID=1002107 RepID=UPI002545181C|nr:uncharacterized protein N7518_005999 [Penicillium psychrosexuale]KAJ5788988.1 hypothetical protein N7518_005999 [Penicillium psychrosexuale]
MGFHKSSNGINVKDKHILTAYCQKPGGETTYSELDLDGFIGVNKGRLAWGAHDFSKCARDVELKLEGPENNPILHAKFDDGQGNVQESEVNLADCIKNIDGRLNYMECF